MGVIKPKMYFENREEADKCLAEWKARLFLSDWNIKLFFDTHLDDNNSGLSEVIWTLSCGKITMLCKGELEKEDYISKQPQEQILIHELLHFKYLIVENRNATIEDVHYSENQHQLLEQMAKSLYMTKYNLDYEWFKN